MWEISIRYEELNSSRAFTWTLPSQGSSVMCIYPLEFPIYYTNIVIIKKGDIVNLRFECFKNNDNTN